MRLLHLHRFENRPEPRDHRQSFGRIEPPMALSALRNRSLSSQRPLDGAMRPGNDRISKPIRSLKGKAESRCQQPRSRSRNERQECQHKQPSASFHEAFGF
jgi:hypothetical protein